MTSDFLYMFVTMKKCVLMLFFFAPVFLFSQEAEEVMKEHKAAQIKDHRYTNEASGGLKIQSNGVALYFDYGWIKDIYKTHLLQVEYQYFINYKNKLVVPNAAYDGRRYYYGYQNEFHAVRVSYGFERCIADKAERNGVRLSFIGFVGFSLGITKPYYLEIYKGRDNTNGQILHESVRYSNSSDSQFMNQDSIYGASPSYKGLNQMLPYFGGHLKLGLNFDWGTKDRFVKALEVGVMTDIYYRNIPVYVNKDANNFIHPALYIGFRFGKRW